MKIRTALLGLGLLCIGLDQIFAYEPPLVSSASAGSEAGTMASVVGKVIEVRRVDKGPVIFELDGVPAKPVFRVLVYPMAVRRFGADPENLYLGQTVKATGQVVVRKNLPQMWINDPTHIQVATPEEQKKARESAGATSPTASPTPGE